MQKIFKKNKARLWKFNFSVEYEGRFVGWLYTFNVGLELRDELSRTVWDSPVSVVQRHVITILILHWGGGFSALVVQRLTHSIKNLAVEQINKNTTPSHTRSLCIQEVLPSTNRDRCCLTGLLWDSNVKDKKEIKQRK